MQTQRQSQASLQPASRFKLWLKSHTSSSDSSGSSRTGTRSAAYQRAAKLQQVDRVKPPKSNLPTVSTIADKGYKTEQERSTALIERHGGAQKALIWAIEKKDQRAISCLLDTGIKDAELTGFHRCLQLSLQETDTTLFGRLLHLTDESDLLGKLLAESDLFWLVVRHTNKVVLDILLYHADEEAKNLIMRSAIKFSVHNVVPALLAKGTNPNSCYHGRSILPRAVFFQDMDNVVALLSNTMTDINALAVWDGDNVRLRPAIEVAIITKNYQILEELLKHPNIDVNIVDSQGNTPLHFAAKGGSLPIVKLLLKHGADTLKRNQNNHQAAHVAGEAGKKDVLNHFRELVGLPAITWQLDHSRSLALSYTPLECPVSDAIIESVRLWE